MKNLIVNIFKTLFFFDLSVILLTVLPERKTGTTEIINLWNEATACILLLALTFIFHKVVEKNKFPIKKGIRNLKFLPLGLLAGAAIPVIYTVIMRITKGYNFDGFNKVPKLWLWILAIFLSALWNELLLRGYLFRLYKKHYGFLMSTIITTALFISMNHEILKFPKANLAIIILFNVLLCFLLEITNSVIFTVCARFSYTFISGMMFGSKYLFTDYPRLSKYSFSGKPKFTGGEYLLEGSNITLIVLIITVSLIFILKYKAWQYLSKKKLKSYIASIKHFFAVLKFHINVHITRTAWFFKRITRRHR